MNGKDAVRLECGSYRVFSVLVQTTGKKRY